MPPSVPRQFVCDGCGRIIPSAREGFVEWLTDIGGKHHGFRIIHAQQNGTTSCREYRHHPEGKLIQLERMIGLDGIAYALSLLHPGALHEVDSGLCGVRNAAEFANFMRRLSLPHFDEASRFFEAAFGDRLHLEIGETDFYSERNLQQILRRYRE